MFSLSLVRDVVHNHFDVELNYRWLSLCKTKATKQNLNFTKIIYAHGNKSNSTGGLETSWMVPQDLQQNKFSPPL